MPHLFKHCFFDFNFNIDVKSVLNYIDVFYDTKNININH